MLTLLTYAGLIVTAVFTIWGLTHELYTKDENQTRRLTRAGWYSIGLAVLGLFVGLGAATANRYNDQERKRKSAEQAQTVINEVERSRRPLFPLKVSAIFQADLRHPSYEAYRQRLIKAAPADEESAWPELAPDTPLFPDRNREKDAYALLVAPAQVRVFLVRHPAEPAVSFEKEEIDLSFMLKTTAADPPVPAGKKPIHLPRVMMEYAFSKDGIVSIHLPAEELSQPDYSQRDKIVSDLDLVGAQMTVKISPWFTLYSISIELPEGEIQLHDADFKRGESGNGTPVYIFRFPATKEGFSKLFVS